VNQIEPDRPRSLAQPGCNKNFKGARSDLGAGCAPLFSFCWQHLIYRSSPKSSLAWICPRISPIGN
jgi:hypothetical protein